MSEAPGGWRIHRAGRRRLGVSADYEAVALGLGLLEPGGFARLLAAGDVGPAGRTATRVVPLPGRGERLHVRPARRGGLAGACWRDRVPGWRRHLRELQRQAHLRQRGVALPRPVLVAAVRGPGPLWRVAVASVHVEDSVDAEALLAGLPERSRRLRAAAAAGEAVRALHDAGALHGDLHLKNLLLLERGDDTRALLVDLAPSRRAPPDARQRMAELMRLYRSLLKRRLLDAAGRDGCESFLRAYTRGDAALHSALLAHLPRERRRVALHALGYRLRRR